MNSVTKKILAFNSDRVPRFVQLKYQFINADVFRFFRGTCHLFFEALSKKISWEDGTKCWITGDLHLENFGTYKGDNHVVYFDLNDFDEAVLAPATWELSRTLTSIHLAAQVLDFSEALASELCNIYTNAWLHVLNTGKPLVVEKETATGLLEYLLEQVEQRSPKDFILSRLKQKNGHYKIIIDKVKTFSIEHDKEKEHLIEKVQEWTDEHYKEKEYKVLDMACRIAGTGSVGVQRYAILFEEKKTERLHLGDLKEAKPSSLKPYEVYIQPEWASEAERVVTLQKRVEHVAPAFLHPVIIDKTPFVIKQLQPTQDRMDLALCKGKKKKLADILITMAHASASGLLRSGGRQGSSIADEMIAFAANNGNWKKDLLQYARQYAKQVMKDYTAYKTDYDKGVVKAPGQ